MASNPAQWPSFDNWSVRYAEYALGRIRLLEATALLIQRVWRQRKVARKHRKVYPIVLGGRPFIIRQCVTILQQGDSLLNKKTEAHEKLDGANLGVRCDGAIFGRRQKIEQKSYQRVSLEGILPDTGTLGKVKRELLADNVTVDKEAVKLILYGELICNPGRYHYDTRGMGHKWYPFGIIIQTQEIGPEQSVALLDNLLIRDYWASLTPDASKLTLRLNKQLTNLLTGCGVPCLPHMACGSIREVCLALQDKLMEKDGLEGVVLTGSDVLIKWKTANEDESKGHAMLVALDRDFADTVFRVCCLDRTMVQLLIKVSARPNGAASRQAAAVQKAKKPKKVAKESAIDPAVLDIAYQSAASKYDDPSVYFEREERNEIITLLTNEITKDLMAHTPEQVACVTNLVKKQIGRAFGAWVQSSKTKR